MGASITAGRCGIGPATAEAAGSSTVVPAIPLKHLEGIGKTVLVHDAPNQKKWPENGKGFRDYCWSNPGPRIKQLILDTLRRSTLQATNSRLHALYPGDATYKNCHLSSEATRRVGGPGANQRGGNRASDPRSWPVKVRPARTYCPMVLDVTRNSGLGDSGNIELAAPSAAENTLI